MYLFIGLGNPGEKYKGTRHNAGFKAMDEVRRVFGFPEWVNQAKFEAETSSGSGSGPCPKGRNHRWGAPQAAPSRESEGGEKPGDHGAEKNIENNETMMETEISEKRKLARRN